MHKNDTRPFSPWDLPLALTLLTRLPLPTLPKKVFARQARAAWAFPLVGLVVGTAACAIGVGAAKAGLPAMAAAALVVVVLVLLTGAMHEDGLADTADGLWGGFTADRRLEIMKDSHIGTYGVLALIFSQLLRVIAITDAIAAGAVLGIVAAAVFSRALMPPLMRWLPNARGTGLSQNVGSPPAGSVICGLGLATILVIFLGGWLLVVPAISAALAVALLAAVARAKIGGQTGDILGATQQISEIIFLLALTAVA